MVNVANVITVSRVVLALFTLALLYLPATNTILWTVFGLTVFVIWADGLDGYFARKLNQSSKFGAILDIAGDRAVEMAYWIVFASLGWIAVWVPLLYLVRGTFVDALRSQASEQGYTAFGAKTMMQSPLGKFLVASNFSRFTYAVVKALAFCLIIACHIPTPVQSQLAITADVMVYISAAFCLVRGLPVLFESGHLFKATQ
ncbi:MAG: CDP-alcohol phosphatidyltransferase family protein [Cyanobacteriota bacterium erpe_2018_sw_39hr_WHONDRS-SW48-000098_B_bin.30]|jgi:phosphatidylglycerophosphate synthase|nr:CDP-alcohol phosphatidyltransferase family protein [Candidatus Obscuribacter sp.]MBK9622448.1 CDP-alcohol phosphatidyltransferase family protein [Candidatus Obscuribacter sp.]MDQ5966295.1 CDP-alcohol phosphatidyltransferase family protein [Cyanobacteriota bacterium erpe_2018_sw_39hr_WHONDRS-SW48-000098_B_bin.30]